jgi:hypothetical protein
MHPLQKDEGGRRTPPERRGQASPLATGGGQAAWAARSDSPDSESDQIPRIFARAPIARPSLTLAARMIKPSS